MLETQQYHAVVPEQPIHTWGPVHTWTFSFISVPEVEFWVHSVKSAWLKEVNIIELKQGGRHMELLRLEPWALCTETSTLYLSNALWWDRYDPVDIRIPGGRNSLRLSHPSWKEALQCLCRLLGLACFPQTWQGWRALKTSFGSHHPNLSKHLLLLFSALGSISAYPVSCSWPCFC